MEGTSTKWFPPEHEGLEFLVEFIARVVFTVYKNKNVILLTTHCNEKNIYIVSFMFITLLLCMFYKIKY